MKASPRPARASSSLPGFRSARRAPPTWCVSPTSTTRVIRWPRGPERLRDRAGLAECGIGPGPHARGGALLATGGHAGGMGEAGRSLAEQDLFGLVDLGGQKG